MCLRLSVLVWNLGLALPFLSVCMDSCAYAWQCVLAFLSVCMDSCAAFARVSQCLYGLLCLRLRFSVFVWTLVFALPFLSVCMDFCACACVSQCLYLVLCLRLRFSVFVWTLVLAFAFLSVCVDSCACAVMLASLLTENQAFFLT